MNYKVWPKDKIYIHEDVIIKDNTEIISYDTSNKKISIYIDRGVKIGKKSTICGHNNIRICKNVTIKNNVLITDKENTTIKNVMKNERALEKNNEVIIGYGSFVSANCILEGSLTIGRGCLIKPNTLVNSDIPDFCVVEGTPFKIVEIYDYKTMEWVKVKNEEYVEFILQNRKKVKPIISICIPTYNRAKYLSNCLKSIYAQIEDDPLFEVIVSDNDSKDNTKEIVDIYKQKYKNFIYVKNSENIGGDKNVYKVMEMAKGEYINPHGDDDYFEEGILYDLLNLISKNKGQAIFYMNNKENKELNIYKGKGKDDYLKYVSINCTFMSELLFNRNEYFKLKDRNKFINTKFNQSYLTFRILENNPNFCILNGKIFSVAGDSIPIGYNLGEIFIENYIEMLKYFNINKSILVKEKRKMFVNLLLPWYKKILKDGNGLSVADFKEKFIKYYKEDMHFDEMFNKIIEVENNYKNKG